MPDLGALDHAGKREIAHVLGGALIQPQAIPPFHRDQIAKPHVGHLVENDLGHILAFLPRGGAPAHILLPKGHGRLVLHGRVIEVRNDDLVILAVRVRYVEILLVELEPLTRPLKPVFEIDMLGDGAAAKQSERNGIIARVRVRHVKSVANVAEAGDASIYSYSNCTRQANRPPPRP